VTHPSERDRDVAEAILSDPPKDRWYYLGKPWWKSRRYAIAQALADRTEECAKIAEDPNNLDRIGGSTGNAFGTSKRIATAIREGKS